MDNLDIMNKYHRLAEEYCNHLYIEGVESSLPYLEKIVVVLLEVNDFIIATSLFDKNISRLNDSIKDLLFYIEIKDHIAIADVLKYDIGHILKDIEVLLDDE